MDLATGKQGLNADGQRGKLRNLRRKQARRPGPQLDHPAIPSGFADQNIRSRYSPAYYCLYGIERWPAYRHRVLGQHDWYRIGCEYLVGSQQTDGSWQAPRGALDLDRWPLVATSFSLLFKLQGPHAVLLTKLAHNEGDDWNNNATTCEISSNTRARLFKRNRWPGKCSMCVRNPPRPTRAG